MLGATLDRINVERILCFLLGDFHLDLLRSETQVRTSDFLHILLNLVFLSLYLQAGKRDQIICHPNRQHFYELLTDISDHFHFHLSFLPL